MTYSANISQVLEQIFQLIWVKIKDFVLSGLNKEMHTCMILIDLQEAFNTLDHKIFEMTTFPGLKTPVIKWFQSYLSSSKFLVCMDDFFLGAVILNCGVS